MKHIFRALLGRAARYLLSVSLSRSRTLCVYADLSARYRAPHGHVLYFAIFYRSFYIDRARWEHEARTKRGGSAKFLGETKYQSEHPSED